MRLAVATLALLWAASPAHAQSAALPSAPQTKKAVVLSAKAAGHDNSATKKAWQAELRRRIAKPPNPVINIYNTWTHETVVVDAELKGTKALPTQAVNSFLRCHFTNEPTKMDPRLFRTLIDAAKHFRVDRVDIVSGFRAPKYNLVLRKKGRGVARDSQHPKGNAVDFRLPGVATKQLRKWVQSRKLGGVGYYPSSGFIHMDTGRVRTWTGK